MAIALPWSTVAVRAESVKGDQSIPTAIIDFYVSHNALSQLGTEIDREVAIDSLMCEGKVPTPSHGRLEYCQYLPEQLSLEQAEIQDLVLTLEPQIVRTLRESPMVISDYSPGWGSYLRATRPNAEPLTTSADLFPAKLYQPIAVERYDETALSIEVLSCNLERSQPWQSLDQDVEPPATGSDFEPNSDAISTCYTSTVERHRWTMTENQWMKVEPDLVLVEPSLSDVRSLNEQF